MRCKEILTIKVSLILTIFIILFVLLIFSCICELGILSDEKQGNLDKGNIFLVKEKEYYFTFRRLIYFFQ